MDSPHATSEPVSSIRDDYDALRFVTDEHACAYLPGRQSRSEVYLAEGLAPAGYTSLLAGNFRRSGRVVYRPRCRACQECRQLRVPVDQFSPTRSMRRVLRRNDDLTIERGDLAPTDEKHALFAKYLRAQHDGTMSDDFDSFVGFLYDTPFDTVEYVYSLDGRTVGVSLVDPCADGLSSVYMYFDPDERQRSLGTFSVLCEIEDCVRRGLPYYYLGYHVAGSRTMAYKARFRPCQVLVANQRWIYLQA